MCYLQFGKNIERPKLNRSLLRKQYRERNLNQSCLFCPNIGAGSKYGGECCAHCTCQFQSPSVPEIIFFSLLAFFQSFGIFSVLILVRLTVFISETQRQHASLDCQTLFPRNFCLFLVYIKLDLGRNLYVIFNIIKST